MNYDTAKAISLLAEVEQLKKDKDKLAEALKASLSAIRYAESNYLTYSAGSEIWAFVNGYAGNPNAKKLLKELGYIQEK